MALVTSRGEKIKKNECITIFKTDAKETIAGDLVTFDDSVSNTEKLTFSNNSIVIGKNVSKVKVSSNITFYTTNTTRQWFRMKKNGAGIVDVLNYGTSEYATLSITPKIINVEENDTINIYLHNTEGTGNITISQGVEKSSTYLTVEIVE